MVTLKNGNLHAKILLLNHPNLLFNHRSHLRGWVVGFVRDIEAVTWSWDEVRGIANEVQVRGCGMNHTNLFLDHRGYLEVGYGGERG